MNKAAVTLTVLLTTLLSSGCGTMGDMYLPWPWYAKVVWKQAAQTSDGRFVLYGSATTDFEHSGRWLDEFGDENRVKRRHRTRCPKRKRDPRCDPDPTTSLLAMLAKYYDAAVVSKYRSLIGLCDAANRGDHDTVEELLAQGADVNSRCGAGRTPLHAALELPNVDPGATENHVKTLLDKGADVNAKTEDGWTPLHYATSEENTTVIEMLLAKGADVNAKTEFGWTGWTPLHYAAWDENTTVVEMLLAAGASVTIVDENGKTPIDVATDQKVIELLKQHASKIELKRLK